MTRARLRVPSACGPPADVLAGLIEPGAPEDGLVFVADPDLGGGWSAVSLELREAFELTRKAAAAAAPIVYVVHADDLLGRRGAERAMVATGLLSGARSAAFELQRAGVPVNVLALTDTTPGETAADWVLRLLRPRPGGPTGELVRCGGDHLGGALP